MGANCSAAFAVTRTGLFQSGGDGAIKHTCEKGAVFSKTLDKLHTIKVMVVTLAASPKTVF